MRLVPWLLLLILPGFASGMSVTLEPAAGTAGTVVTLRAALTEPSAEGEFWYRYRVRGPDAAVFRTVRDFAPDGTFELTPMDGEGEYEVEVTARSRETGETAVSFTTVHVDPVATGDQAVVTRTARAQVFLYSAPVCPAGAQFRVAFEPVEEAGVRQFTPPVACNGSRTMNVYVAGLKAGTEYRAWHQVSGADGRVAESAAIAFRSGEAEYAAAPTRAIRKSGGATSQGVLLQSSVFQLNVATDLDGNVVWVYPQPVRYLTRPEAGGYFFALVEVNGGRDTDQRLRVIDLAGNVVLETNAGRINEQLAALGMGQMTSFHHEARRIADGRILVLAGTERMLRDVQGPGDVDVIGDMILVLDGDLQLEWAWDAFDHLDARRMAVLGETCQAGTGGCPQFRLAEEATDWLHGNSLQLTPDGHILYSARHQDWVIKIDYANGRGSGGVLWRLGRGGDFRLVSTGGEDGWFSHQHDANFEEGPGLTDRMMVFDNGNTRYAEDESVHSRGQVYLVDEAAMTATLTVNIDLGKFAVALGSAVRLENGNYHFNLGWMPNGFSQSLEFDPGGGLVTQIETETPLYRSFRMRDLYTP